MSTITSNNPNPLPGGFPNTGSNIGAAPSATPPLELGTVIKAGGNNKALLDQLVQTLGTQQGNASDGLKNANGAPAIASPLDNISSDDLIDLLQAMRSKSQDQQLATAKTGLDGSRLDAQRNNEAQQKKIQDWIKKCEKADKASLAQKIFGWIGKIFAVIAAAIVVVASVAASPFTGGASLALTALAVVGLVGATMSLADQISKEAGGPEISLSNMMTKLVGGLLKACGVPEEKAEQIGKALAGVLAVAAPVALLVEPKLLGTVASGIAALSGADPDLVSKIEMGVTIAASVTVGIGMAVAGFQFSKLAGEAVNITAKLTTAIMGAVAQTTQGVTAIGQGAAGIAKGGLTADGDKAMADKKALEALMLKINQQMDEQRDDLRKIIQQMEESMQVVSQIMQGTADSMKQITGNIGKRAPV